MIFPKPIEEKYKEGFYTLKNVFVYDELYFFYNAYKNGNTDISIQKIDGMEKEEYRISIDENGVEIQCFEEAGKFRAFTSLRQLLKENSEKLPYVEIHDKPDYKRRSYMLDISRCRMPKVETLVKFIDLLADLKYNELQLYMDGLVFKYDAFPEYFKDFECLDVEDIEYLDQYCYDRFIDLVPHQNSFGHLEKWLEKPELKHLGLTDGTIPADTINPLLEESIEFIDKLYGSLLPHFRSKYVCIGLDEAWGLGKFQTEEACKKYGNANVFMDLLNRLSELCEKKYGKTVMFWSDMISNYPESHHRIPKNAIALNWGYELTSNIRILQKCEDLEKMNIPYYVCPGNTCWVSFTGRFEVMSFTVRNYGELGREHGAMGYMMTDWGNGGHTHFLEWSLTPAALAAQYAWNAGFSGDVWKSKQDYVYAAEEYLDKNIYKARVAHLLRHMQQYYVLEPERVHSATLCAYIFEKKLTETEIPFAFDLKKCGDNFYFDNVIEYMKKNICELESINFDERLKREIKINADMVILATELLKVRTKQQVSREKCQKLCNDMKHIAEEYKELWLYRNYEKGMEHFLNVLAEKEKELQELRDVE